MELRKIQLVGNRSYAVSLPKGWVLGNKLKEQDVLSMEVTSNNDLLVRKIISARKNESKTIAVHMDDVIEISEFLVFCYVKNIDVVQILLDDANVEKLSEIRRILKYLEGYDITSEDATKIELSFVFNDINMTLQKIIIRMLYLIKQSLTFVKAANVALVQDNELSVDRLYHLSRRIIFSCVRSEQVRRANAIKYDEDIFFFANIFKKIEQIGDTVCLFGKLKLSTQELNAATDLITLLEDVFLKKKTVHQFKNKLAEISLPKGNSRTTQIVAKIHERSLDIFEDLIAIEFNQEFF